MLVQAYRHRAEQAAAAAVEKKSTHEETAEEQRCTRSKAGLASAESGGCTWAFGRPERSCCSLQRVCVREDQRSRERKSVSLDARRLWSACMLEPRFPFFLNPFCATVTVSQSPHLSHTTAAAHTRACRSERAGPFAAEIKIQISEASERAS